MHLVRSLILGLVFLSIPFLSAPAIAGDLVLQPNNYVIDASINGHPVRLRVDPSAPGYIILNPAAVQRIGLRPSMTRARTTIGPVVLRGSSKTADVTIAGTTSERRLLWWDRAIVSEADGVVSIADLPYDRVTLTLGQPRAGEQAFQLPFQRAAGSGLTHRMRVGDQELVLTITLNKPESLATAAAGALIAQLHAGAWAGEPREEPVSFGVRRPVRPLALGQPMPIVAGLVLTRMLVRTQDHRGNAQLPREADADPEEIVVTAATGRRRPLYVLTLGRDWLAPCSSVSWDNRTRLMTLNCVSGAVAPGS